MPFFIYCDYSNKVICDVAKRNRITKKEVFTMEKKQKDLISILLLAVGVFFILVAGSIFVTTAWKYLPVLAKQFALLGVASGMFVASGKVGHNERLAWISQTLFHVGNAFVGFFIIAIMGGIVDNSVTGNAFKILIASGVMAMITGLKTIAQKHVSDLITLILLINTMLISGCVALETAYGTYVCLFGVLTLMLAFLDGKGFMDKQEGSFHVCISIAYLIHVVLDAMLVVPYCFASLFDKEALVKGLIMTVVFLLTITVSYVMRKQIVIRVMQSLAIGFSVLYLVNGAFLKAEYSGEYGLVVMVCVLIASILMVCLNRTEITITMCAVGFLLPFASLIYYWFDAFFCIFDDGSGEYVAQYYPHSLILGLAYVALYIARYGCDNMATALKKSRLLKFAFVQIVSGLFVYIVTKSMDTCAMIVFLLLAINAGFVASIFEKNVGKRIFLTCAAILYVAAIGCQPFVRIPEAFTPEWSCFLIAINIVLFRYIWYDYREKMSSAYFVVTCVLLGYLLLYNLCCGGIGNVLILGVTGIAMLILASIRNDKRYVIAASATLIALVLYLTRAFWLSIAWWVYLFVAGVLLVGLSIKKAKEV